MPSSLSVRLPRLGAFLAVVALALPTAAVAAVALPGGPQVIKNAACSGNKSGTARTSTDCDSEKELAGFVRAADAIVSPAVIAMIAVAPIACLVGAGALMFGSRRGLMIIGAALGTLVFVASVKGIVA